MEHTLIRIKVKKQSISKLKKKLWTLVSQYVRQQAADDFDEMVSCYTCNNRKHWKEMQAGHYITRSFSPLLFCLDNIRPQCYGCNVCQQGKPVEFRHFLVAELGEERVEEMEAMKLAGKSKKWNRDELEMLIDSFKDMLK